MKLKPIYGSIREELQINSFPKRLQLDILAAFAFKNPVYQATLRFSPYGYVSPSIPEFIELARVDGPLLCCPRGIDPDRQLSDKGAAMFRRIKWADYRQMAPCKFPQLLIALNREQRILLKAFEKQRTEEEHFGNFLYVAPTGAGKTILLAQAAKKLGQRTLILFSTDQVKRAWYMGLEKAYGLAPRDIGLIQRNKFDIKDPFTIGSIQTIARRRKHWPELFKQIGTLVVDEADLVTAFSFWSFILSCPARYIIGATATDRPEKTPNFYLRACFGETRKRIMNVQRDTETVMMVRKAEAIPTSFVYNTNGMIDWHDLSDCITMDEDRNRLIVASVIRDLRKGHPCLIVTKRLAHVEILHDMLKARGVKTANKLTGETNSDRIYTEKLVHKVLSGHVNCVIATTQAVKRGANLNPLAVLHIAMPSAKKNDIEQVIGRIRRKAKGKTECRVVYYLDVHSSYLLNVYKRYAVPVFRRLKVPEFDNTFVA